MKFSSSFTVVMKTSSLQLPSLEGALSIKSMLQSAPKHVIFILKIHTHKHIYHEWPVCPLKIQKFSGEGAQPPPPAGGGHPLPHLPHSAPAAPRSSRRSFTHPPPTWKSGYGPDHANDILFYLQTMSHQTTSPIETFEIVFQVHRRQWVPCTTHVDS